MAYECKAYQPVQEMARFLRRNPPLDAQIRELARTLAGAVAWLDALVLRSTADDLRLEYVDEAVRETTSEADIACRLLKLAYPIVDTAMNIRERIEHTRSGRLEPPPLPLPMSTGPAYLPRGSWPCREPR